MLTIISLKILLFYIIANLPRMKKLSFHTIIIPNSCICCYHWLPCKVKTNHFNITILMYFLNVDWYSLTIFNMFLKLPWPKSSMTSMLLIPRPHPPAALAGADHTYPPDHFLLLASRTPHSLLFFLLHK